MTTKPKTSFGERLRAMRKDRQLTQEQLESQTGLSQRYISNLELDQSDPTLSAIKKLAKALSVTVGQLCD